jgi:hypothetical protein
MDHVSPWLRRLIQDDQEGSDRQQDAESVMPEVNFVVFRSELDVDCAGYARYTTSGQRFSIEVEEEWWTQHAPSALELLDPSSITLSV